MEIWIASGRKGSAIEVDKTNHCQEFLCLQRMHAREGVQRCLVNSVVIQIMTESNAGS